MSDYTKALKNKYLWFKVLDWLCLFAPTIIYVIVALFSTGVVVTGKVAIVSTVLIALILTLFNIIVKKKISCIPWILLIGLHIAFSEYLFPLIIIMAITSALHDFLLMPLVNSYKIKVISSKTIDDREAFSKN